MTSHSDDTSFHKAGKEGLIYEGYKLYPLLLFVKEHLAQLQSWSPATCLQHTNIQCQIQSYKPSKNDCV